MSKQGNESKKCARCVWIPFAALLLLDLGPAYAIVNACISPDEAIMLTVLAVFIPLGFIAFDLCLNKSKVESRKNNSSSKPESSKSNSGSNANDTYYPNFRLWGYGFVLGTGAVILYLLIKVSTSFINVKEVDLSGDAGILIVWRGGILLLLLSAALAFILYALVRIAEADQLTRASPWIYPLG